MHHINFLSRKRLSLTRDVYSYVLCIILFSSTSALIDSVFSNDKISFFFLCSKSSFYFSDTYIMMKEYYDIHSRCFIKKKSSTLTIRLTSFFSYFINYYTVVFSHGDYKSLIVSMYSAMIDVKTQLCKKKKHKTYSITL